jgi:hypothetical protein
VKPAEPIKRSITFLDHVVIGDAKSIARRRQKNLDYYTTRQL